MNMAELTTPVVSGKRATLRSAGRTPESASIPQFSRYLSPDASALQGRELFVSRGHRRPDVLNCEVRRKPRHQLRPACSLPGRARGCATRTHHSITRGGCDDE